MECKVEKTQNANEVKLEIKIEAEKFENAIKKVYFQNAKYFNIPGFRKGKAPQNIVERYYGKEIFYEDAFNDLVPDEYEKALEENKIEAVSRPKIDIVTMEKGKDLEFIAIVETKPEVKIDKYKGIEIEKIEYTVKDKDVKDELSKMQEQNSRLVSVEDRSVEDKDIATIDFEGFVDGVAFDGGKGENYDLEIGSGSFIPGFEEQVIGIKIGEEKEINVKFPEEYYSKDLAGKDATFKVKVNGIKKKEVPELDDEFAKDVSEFDTLKELKASIKERLEKENKEKEKYEKEDAVIKAICEKMEVEIPNGMVEIEVENMVKDMEQRISYQGLRLEQYLQFVGKTEAEFKEEYKPQAIQAIKSRLALEEIIKQEKIEATEEEISEKLEEMAKNYGKTAEDLEKNENVKKYIKDGIESQKAIDMLVENAKVKTAKKEAKKEVKKETKKETKNEEDKKAE